MARFSVYSNPDGGYLLDVQANLLNHLNTRIVVPLMSVADAPKPARTLNPLFDVGGTSCVMVTQFMAAVPSSILKQHVASLESHRNEIVSALDLLMQGF